MCFHFFVVEFNIFKIVSGDRQLDKTLDHPDDISPIKRLILGDKNSP